MPRILVLDDEKLIRWSLGQIFSQEGYEVDVVENPEDARRLSQINRYQVVFADLEVCGERAESFFKEMLGGQPEAALVIITAMPRDKAGEKLGGCRPFRILEKPFSSEDIKTAALEALRSHPIPPEPSKEV